MIHVHSNGIDGSNLWRFWRAPGTHSIWIRRGSDVRCARQFSILWRVYKKEAGDRRKPQVCQENCPEVEVKKSRNIVVIPFNLLNFLANLQDVS